jgi:amidase
MTTAAADLCFQTATELARRIRARDLSAREVMAAHLAQIERVNPRVNAIVTLVAEQALARAAEADERLARGEPVGPLHGLPVAHKDTVNTRGIRTTQGSPIYRDFVPDEDAILVTRLREAGAIAVGKTNVPEFAAGSHTFNEVFGATLNPYDTTKTCGGSSGGAAVALACGMVPLADGSDYGGSLRNPANFCNVVGFRTAPGRVPGVQAMAWQTLSVLGPMGRTVQDVALMLSVLAGPDPRSPISIVEPGEVFRRPLARDPRGVRVALAPDLGGLPVDPRVRAVVEAAGRTLADLGCEVEEAAPDFAGADEVFYTLRGYTFAQRFLPLMETHRDLIKPEVIWNAEQGQKLSGLDISRAETLRTEIYQRMRRFMEPYEFIVAPVNQVPPFDVSLRYPTEIVGVPMSNYLEWMKSCWLITLTGHPAISVPGGFTPEGLPVGVQIVGRHQAEFAVLQLAHAFEQATRHGERRPPAVQSPASSV